MEGLGEARKNIVRSNTADSSATTSRRREGDRERDKWRWEREGHRGREPSATWEKVVCGVGERQE